MKIKILFKLIIIITCLIAFVSTPARLNPGTLRCNDRKSRSNNTGYAESSSS